MNYRYDPILCMNVPVKAQDENTFAKMKRELAKAHKIPENQIETNIMGYVTEYTSNKTGELLGKYNSKTGKLIVNSLDSAIKACDATINTLLFETTEPAEDTRALSRYGLKVTKKNMNSMGETVLQVSGTKEQFMKAHNDGYFYDSSSKIKNMKDAKPIPVSKVIEKKDSYYIIQDTKGYYWVTKDKTGNGGGTMEFSYNAALKTLNDYLTMDKLEKKYGKVEGYKKWMKGEKE